MEVDEVMELGVTLTKLILFSISFSPCSGLLMGVDERSRGVTILLMSVVEWCMLGVALGNTEAQGNGSGV